MPVKLESLPKVALLLNDKVLLVVIFEEIFVIPLKLIDAVPLTVELILVSLLIVKSPRLVRTLLRVKIPLSAPVRIIFALVTIGLFKIKGSLNVKFPVILMVSLEVLPTIIELKPLLIWLNCCVLINWVSKSKLPLPVREDVFWRLIKSAVNIILPLPELRVPKISKSVLLESPVISISPLVVKLPVIITPSCIALVPSKIILPLVELISPADTISIPWASVDIVPVLVPVRLIVPELELIVPICK